VLFRSTGKEAQRLDWYVKQVVKGRIASAARAAREYLAERERLRRRRTPTPWPSIQRTEQGVRNAILKLARQLGWNPGPRSEWWTKPEASLLDRYAGALAEGRYPSARAAVPLLQRELAELHGPGKGGPKARGYDGVMHKLLARSRELGRHALKLVDFAPEEERVIDAYAGAFQKGRYPSVQAAVRACRQEFARLRRRRPRPGWLAVSRSFNSIATRLLEVVHERGVGPLRPRVSRPEQDKIDGYVRRVLAGELSYNAAAREYLNEVSRLRERHPDLEWVQYRRPHNGVVSIIGRLCRLARRQENEGQRLFSARKRPTADSLRSGE